MLRSRFLWKLSAAYVGCIVLTAITVGSIASRHLSRDDLREMRRSLQNHAIVLQEVVAADLKAGAKGQLRARLQRLGITSDVGFAVIQADGTVLADSRDESTRMDNLAEQPEIMAARSQRFGDAVRFSHAYGKRAMYVAVPVYSQTQLIGFVRAVSPLNDIDEQLAYLRTMTLLSACMVIAIGFLLGWFFTRKVTHPLRLMTTMAALIAGGNYDQQIRTYGRDEIGEFAQTFNRMAYHLRERMETVTKERNQLLAVFGSMVEGVIAVDRDERVVHMNQAAGVMLHTAPEIGIGKRIWEVTRIRPIVEILSETIHAANDIIREAHIIDQPHEQTIEMHAAPLRNSQGMLAGAVVVLYDVSELRRLENIRREFVANVSHELKTPITALKGFVETLRDGALDDHQQAERFLSIIARHADRLHAIIEDLLSLSRLEQEEDAIELPRHRERLSVVMEAAVQDCAAKAAAREVTIVTACDPDLWACINAALIEQALVNLLDNAINYSKTGSTVRVEAQREGDEVAISVRDQGLGIAQEHLPRLFERFYRVDKARSREHGGTGLGLAIVKHIALAHGGRVAVCSNVNEGSMFSIHLSAS
jgi:two-component system phosphate regulon sensor histidine kinase PhoR